MVDMVLHAAVKLACMYTYLRLYICGFKKTSLLVFKSAESTSIKESI